MTKSEARGYIQGKLNCMNKCDVFEREDKLKYNKDICDDCEYCYSQGNFGQQKEAFEIAIKALENQEKIKDLLDSCTAYPDDVCEWNGEQSRFVTYTNFTTACGYSFDLQTNNELLKAFRYCPFCGKKIKVVE